jgi:hypothetical protein
VDLEEELEDVPVGGPFGIEDNLDCLGVSRVVVGGRVLVLPAGVADAGRDDSVAVLQQFLGGPETAPARTAVSVLMLVPAEGLDWGRAGAGPLRHGAAGRTPGGVPGRV